MKTLYRLNVPYGTGLNLLKDHIDIPMSLDGIKMGEWWKSASKDDRIRVVLEGQDSHDYVSAWQKIANEETVESPNDKNQHDLKSCIQRLEAANEDKGQTSPMSDPPVTNP